MAVFRRRPLAYFAVATFACAAPGAAAGAAERVIENGTASWYGGRHIGRTTSSGEVFSVAELTAAHPFLPLGSRVRVTVADTGNSVIVRINDRQPPHGRRIIDVSREAAFRLGMLGRGTAPVVLATITGAADDADPVEVAMAPDTDAGPMSFDDASASAPVSAPRRGRRHTHHARQVAAADHRSNHVPSAIRVRHSAPHRAARHTL